LHSLFLGVDIGGTATKVGLVDETAQVVAVDRVPTRPEVGPEAFVSRVMEAGRALLSRVGAAREALAGVGVGCAGLVSSDSGVLVTSPNLPGWEGVELGRILGGSCEAGVFLDNDANAFAYGEAAAGAAVGKSDGVFLTLGTGVGGGLLLGGRIYRGSDGFGAELGHVVIDADGPPCACGNRGCLESLVGAKAIVERAVETYRRAGEFDTLAEMGGGVAASATPELLSEAASSGDELASRVFRETGRYLGIALGGFINVFNPQIVVIGGGVAQAGEHLLGPARHWAGRYSFSVVISPASLGENGGLVGAALEARDRCGIPCR